MLALLKPTLFANLWHGTGKDILMIATRPPGGSVFLVEDEVMIRMMVADMLEELGYRIAAECGEIGEAMKLAQHAEFDIAILDVNVNGKVISPVADLVKARKIYEWIVANTYRNAANRGCGLGDISFMLQTGDLGGKCADLNALMVGLARASGIPARDLYGIRVAPSQFGYRALGANSTTITGSQHCRAPRCHLPSLGHRLR